MELVLLGAVIGVNLGYAALLLWDALKHSTETGWFERVGTIKPQRRVIENRIEA